MTSSYFEWKKEQIATQMEIVRLCKLVDLTGNHLKTTLASKYNVNYCCQLTDEQLDDFKAYLKSLS